MFNGQYSRWRILIPLAFLLAGESSWAQTGSHTVEADFTGGVTVFHFTKNELVAPKRRDKTGWGDEVIANGYILFATTTPRLMIRTGVGYTERYINMNKFGLGDLFVAIIAFGNVDRDSFKVSRVQLQSKYINIPAGFSYDVTTNARQRVHFIAGLQMNASFATSKKATIVFDETYLVPTAAERAETERIYENTVSGVILGMQPRVDLDIRIHKGAGIKLNLVSFMLYPVSWNKKLATNFFSMGSGMGVYYKF